MNAIEKFKKDKKHRFFILTGEKGTGKTRTALERAVFLQDNYCIDNTDNILIIAKENLDLIVEHIKKEGERDNTVFALLNSDNLEIFSKKVFFHKCYSSISKNHERFCDNDIVKGIILEGIGKLRLDNFRLDKIIVPQNINFLSEEIIFMKDKNIKSLDEYQVLNRKYRGKPIRRNSKVRSAIYSLYDWYCSYMRELGIVDYVDEFNYISQKQGELKKLKYTHIIIDDCERVTVEEIKFLRNLLKDSKYGNFILVRNTKTETTKPWRHYFKNNKAFQQLQSEKFKVVSFKKTPESGDGPKHSKKNGIEDVERNEEKNMQFCNEEILSDNTNIGDTMPLVNIETEKNNFIDSYSYIDLKHNIAHEFALDSGSAMEVILNPKTTCEIVSGEEINEVPVYNEIAAGSPISINDEVEGNFSIPSYWLKGVKKPFILKVKGDSMINAGINDGDYVVINKQSAAESNDIVAVSIDGEATLKRLCIKGNRAVLMPENEKYYPIEIREDNAYIIGKAVGLIKHIH